MEKISHEDKMRIQTSRELGFGYRRVVAKYPGKDWNINTLSCPVRHAFSRNLTVHTAHPAYITLPNV